MAVKLMIALIMMIFGNSIFFSAGDNMTDIYQFEMEEIGGKKIKLEEFRGKVLLIVNVASKCGFTKQYEGLQKLYEQFHEKGLIILGFPANNFLKQEPGSNEEIKNFCQLNYGVTFPMFAKISVGGKDIHPLYRYLTGERGEHQFKGRITWNFNKFLIGRKGDIINRYPSRVKPFDKKLLLDLKNALSAE